MKFENVIIFGCGAAGANTLLNLIRDLPDVNYTIVDYDKVEERNYRVGTQPYLKSHLGKYKTQALQMICMMNTNKKIEIINKKIESQSDLVSHILTKFNVEYWNKTLVIDAFDNAKSKNLLGKEIKRWNRKAEIVHIGFSPLKTGSIIWDDMWSDITDLKKPVDICTLQGAKSFIMSLTSIASIAIQEFYYNDIKTNLFFDSNYFNLRKML